MKRILLSILAISLLVGTSQAQIQKVLLENIKDSVALVADTTDAIGPYSWSYGWVLQVETFDVDAADATVTIQVSNDTSYWINYADNSALTLTDTLGLHAYEDDRLLWQYMRVITAPVSVTSGEYRVKLYGIRANR